MAPLNHAVISSVIIYLDRWAIQQKHWQNHDQYEINIGYVL